MWPTPTPLGIDGLTATPVIYTLPGGDVMAENLVQGYQFVNTHGILDFFWLMLFVLVILLALWGVINRIKSL